MIDLKSGSEFNTAAFVLAHDLVNENGIPITFKRHKFLLAPYMEESKRLVVKKASQIGFSTLAIIKSFHLAKYKKANVIYTLPSKSIVRDFVSPKIVPLVDSNSVLKQMMGETDNLGLKSVGDRFIYFRSSWEPASAIAISAHILINDEVDRSNQLTLSTYQTRLDAALLDRPDLGWWWRFSNPTVDGYGTDAVYQESDQKKWFIKCSRCNQYQELKWPDSINMQTEQYICVFCKRTLSEDDRTNGEWVKKYFGRDISGYQMSQFMAPWIGAKKIIENSKGDQSIFYNFTLGEAYTSKDIQITRESITKCLYPTTNPMTNVVIGVDNGIIKHYVCRNKYGVFRIGSTEDWGEIEHLRNQYDAYMVIDANPYPTPVLKLCEKYRGKVFMNYYDEDGKTDEIIRWGEGDKSMVVKADRTKILDATVADINSQDILFNFSLTELENNQFIAHCLNEYRIVEESAKGIVRGVWRCIEGKPDHFLHALVYSTIALQKTLGMGGVAHTPKPGKEESAYVSPTYAKQDGTIVSGFDFNRLKQQLGRPQRLKEKRY